jgi:hypothetical protein
MEKLHHNNFRKTINSGMSNTARWPFSSPVAKHFFLVLADIQKVGIFELRMPYGLIKIIDKN